MTPTEINVLVAIVAMIFGVAVTNIYKVSRYFKGYSDGLAGLDHEKARAYELGFRDGVQLVDDEDAEGDAEVGELLPLCSSHGRNWTN